MSNNLDRYLPLTESTFYIMLSLIEPIHGYAVMQRVKDISEGTVNLGPGTLYGVFSTLEKENLIIKVSEKQRRKYYTLTLMGKKVLENQIYRLQIMSRNGLRLLHQADEDIEDA